MKQCPVCKTTYTDQSLRFCLVDGASLQALDDIEQPTLVSPNANIAPPNANSSVPPKKSNSVLFAIVGLAALLFLVIIGVGVITYFAFKENNEKTKISNVSGDATNLKPLNVSKTPITTTNSQSASEYPINNTDEIKKKLADLQKKVEEQKKQTADSSETSSSDSTTENYAAPTARVAQTNDGFLSLRTEPSVKTGT